MIGYLLQPDEARRRQPATAPAGATASPRLTVARARRPAVGRRASTERLATAARRPRPPSLAAGPARRRTSWASTGRGSAGSGRTGRIRERDVRRRVGLRRRSGESIPVDADSPRDRGADDGEPATTAPVTLTTTVDATNLVNLREQFKAAAESGATMPSYTDFLVKLAAVALQKHPLLELALGPTTGIVPPSASTSASPWTPTRGCSSR